MGRRKKKISRIVNAVTGILGDEVKGKKLTKTKALKRFVKKMEARREEIQIELDEGGLEQDREALLREHLETLGKQIKRARKVLDA